MLDINLIREHPDLVRKALRDRQMDPAPVDEILALDERRRALLSKVEALKAERNAVSKEIGRMKDPAERQSKIEAMRIVGDQIANSTSKLRRSRNSSKALSPPSRTSRQSAPPSAKTNQKISSYARWANCPNLILSQKSTGTLDQHWALLTLSAASKSLVPAFTS